MTLSNPQNGRAANPTEANVEANVDAGKDAHPGTTDAGGSPPSGQGGADIVVGHIQISAGMIFDG
jgi:hypothetical protein